MSPLFFSVLYNFVYYFWWNLDKTDLARSVSLVFSLYSTKPGNRFRDLDSDCEDLFHECEGWIHHLSKYDTHSTFNCQAWVQSQSPNVPSPWKSNPKRGSPCFYKTFLLEGTKPDTSCIYLCIYTCLRSLLVDLSISSLSFSWPYNAMFARNQLSGPVLKTLDKAWSF